MNFEHRQLVIAKLIGACYDLEDALKISILTAPGDSAMVPSVLRNELSVIRDDLYRIISQLEYRRPS
jgi:hypothetical protein